MHPESERRRSIAILAAMVPELQPLVRALRLAPAPPLGARAFRGTHGAIDVVAAVTEMGTQAATDVTTRLLDATAVDHVLVVGICGAVARELAIGELIVPARVVDEASGCVLRPKPLGGSPRGVLMTTDSLHTDPAVIARFAADGVIALDMETAAIGMVCAARGIPWSVLRAVSDRAGDPAVDADLVGMSNADGTPNPGTIARFLLSHPRRIPSLLRLGRGMRAAVKRSTAAALAALPSL
jgi:adenosylhomocysteine nucleosidase